MISYAADTNCSLGSSPLPPPLSQALAARHPRQQPTPAQPRAILTPENHLDYITWAGLKPAALLWQ
jgi:hypothetical protein